MKKRAVIVERAAHRRLRLVDALCMEFQVDSMEMLDGFVRQVRSIRPELVLIGVGRRVHQSARVAHQIKTDGVRPPLVGLMDWDGRLTEPHTVARETRADGVFLGAPSAEDLRDFVRNMDSDEPVIVGEVRRRGWKRLLGR